MYKGTIRFSRFFSLKWIYLITNIPKLQDIEEQGGVYKKNIHVSRQTGKSARLTTLTD